MAVRIIANQYLCGNVKELCLPNFFSEGSKIETMYILHSWLLSFVSQLSLTKPKILKK